MGTEINTLLLFIIAVGLSFYFISTIFVQEFHKKRNDKTPNIFLFNFLIFRYINRYKIITKGETRHIGPLYYMWTISTAVIVLSTVLLFLLNVIVKGA